MHSPFPFHIHDYENEAIKLVPLILIFERSTLIHKELRRRLNLFHERSLFLTCFMFEKSALISKRTDFFFNAGVLLECGFERCEYGLGF